MNIITLAIDLYNRPCQGLIHMSHWAKIMTPWPCEEMQICVVSVGVFLLFAHWHWISSQYNAQQQLAVPKPINVPQVIWCIAWYRWDTIPNMQHVIQSMKLFYHKIVGPEICYLLDKTDYRWSQASWMGIRKRYNKRNKNLMISSVKQSKFRPWENFCC